MKKHSIQNRKQKIGLPPGTLLYTGKKQVEQVRISCISFSENHFQEQHYTHIAPALDQMSSNGVHWLNIIGLHDESVVEQIGTHFQVNKLSLEDILSLGQRPKIDEFDQHIYLVLKMLTFNDSLRLLEEEQVSFLLLPHVLITFQEREGDVFDFVRERLEAGKGTIRKREADYLLYALLDAIVDHYFTILEKYGDQLYDVEIQLLKHPEQLLLETIHGLRKETVQLRRAIYPLREMVSKLEKSEHDLVQSSTKLFVRDLYDHTIQVIETVEIFRDSALGLSDLYMNSLSNKMNNVMKTLTIIATIFIPLTFIVGIYGMNFKYMPELSHPWGYPVVMLVMLIISVAMMLYFKRKKYF